MKFFTVAALLAMATSALSGTISTTPLAAAKWISVERGVAATNMTSIIERRAGTEVITCYGFGTRVDRAPSISVIDDFCNNHAIGNYVPNGQSVWSRYDYGTFTILVSGAAINNCGGFTVDGNCNRLLRLPLDGCNTKGENGKQGGYETDLCGQWRFDPGSNGSDV